MTVSGSPARSRRETAAAAHVAATTYAGQVFRPPLVYLFVAVVAAMSAVFALTGSGWPIVAGIFTVMMVVVLPTAGYVATTVAVWRSAHQRNLWILSDARGTAVLVTYPRDQRLHCVLFAASPRRAGLGHDLGVMLIDHADQHRLALSLTCRRHLVPVYAAAGFVPRRRNLAGLTPMVRPIPGGGPHHP